MINLRKSAARGHANLGWLDSYHSFSFGHYHDPAFMGFSDLRVINQDVVAAGKGFDTHGHANMEIVTYVMRGALEHQDSLGTTAIIRPGEVQRMSAGTGIRHSEFNPSATEETELLQIWLLPDTQGLTPGYEQKDFGATNSGGALQLVASRDGRQGSVVVHQDVNLYRGLMTSGESVLHTVDTRKAWLQLVRGNLALNDQPLVAGDGAAISDRENLTIFAQSQAEFLLFDLRA
jgi:quercetin 2,3-dioxygenase